MIFTPFIRTRHWLAQLQCRHTLTIFRAHAQTYQKHHGEEAWIDKHKVYNYIRCVKCGRIFPAVQTSRMHGDVDT